MNPTNKITSPHTPQPPNAANNSNENTLSTRAAVGQAIRRTSATNPGNISASYYHDGKGFTRNEKLQQGRNNSAATNPGNSIDVQLRAGDPPTRLQRLLQGADPSVGRMRSKFHA